MQNRPFLRNSGGIGKRVVFRADGNAEIGYGHFVRTLGLAGIINEDFECVFITEEPSDYQVREINKVCHYLISLNKGDNITVFLDQLEFGDIVVIDDYHFDFSYQNMIRNKGCKVIYIDDHNDKHYVCDALVNNIPGFTRESFDLQDYTKTYLGIDYALLRRDFFNPDLRRIVKKKGSIFLSFGGSDPFNISEKLVRFINEISPSSEMNLLIGDAYKYQDRFEEFENLKVYKNIEAVEVARLIARTEMSIVTASSLLNEVSCIGSKVLIGYFADNQIQPYKYFVENGLSRGLGDLRDVDLQLFNDRLVETFNDDSLIESQRKNYRYQQESNLKKIFYDI